MNELHQVLEGTRRFYVGHGDSRELLKILPDNSIDCVVTDPPAGISFMGKAFDSDRGGRDKWIAWLSSILAECYRVMKPGGRMLCWSIPRTMHWTGMAIEDAGWTTENTVAHLFATGFPKAKSQLKPAREDWWLCRKPSKGVPPLNIAECRVETDDSLNGGAYSGDLRQRTEYAPSDRTATTTLSRLNRGAGQFVQPSGRWPANLALSHAEGCVCVGAKRVKAIRASGQLAANDVRSFDFADSDGKETVGDWRCVEGCPVAELDRQSGIASPKPGRTGARGGSGFGFFDDAKSAAANGSWPADPGGGASRFFNTFEVDPDDVATAEFIYAAKVSRADREAGCDGMRRVHRVRNNHPTVKSTKLMQHLVRLIKPPVADGTKPIVLDPFAGSGSTGRAAMFEGCRFIGIECSDTEDEPYATIARRRIAEAEQKTTLDF